MKNTAALIGKTVGFNDNGKCLPLYTVDKFSADGKKYYRTYPDGSGGEWMPTDILLKNLSIGKLLVEGMTGTEIKELCSGRTKTTEEKRFEKQLDRAENPHKYMREY